MVEVNNKTKTAVDEGIVKGLSERFLKQFNKAGQSVSIAFVGDKVMRQLNREYRSKDWATDVLSFPAGDKDMAFGEEDALGEVIIDLAQVKRQAGKYANDFQGELSYILVHGLLHLLGYSDEKESDRAKMLEMADAFLKKK